jgi:hypothetical protein
VAQFYLEATLAGVGSERERGAAARIGTVYDALNDLESPNFFLELQVRGAPDTPPRTGPLKHELSEWLATLDPDAIGTLYADQKYDEIPQKEWSHEGWSVSFRPMPKSPGCRGTPGIRPLGIVAPEAKWLNTHGDLRDAVERKAEKYGALELPLMIAVNVLSMHCDNVDIMNGLFGQETIVVTECADGTLSTKEGGRRPNGAWHGPRGPRKTIVSGVMVVSNLCPWNLGVLTPELFHNPWAQHAIDIEQWALPQYVLDMNRGCFRYRPGLDAPAVLKIPCPWPIPD